MPRQDYREATLPLPVRVPAHQRRRAPARRPSCQRDRAAGRHRRSDKNRTLATGWACAGGVRAPARAPAAARAPRSGKCATRAPTKRAPWCRRRRAPARAPHPRSATSAGRRFAGSALASAIKTRTDETAKPTRRRAAACERSHATGVRRPDTDCPKLTIHARTNPVPNRTKQAPSGPIQTVFLAHQQDHTCLGTLHQPSHDAR
jgi:hypothetical protein